MKKNKKKNKYSFTVDRKKWLRGGSDKQGGAELRNDCGAMCCLGFAMKQLCRVQNSHMLHKGMPTNLTSIVESYYPESLPIFKTLVDIEDAAVEINDAAIGADEFSVEINSTKDRETQLKKLFSRRGIDISFKN